MFKYFKITGTIFLLIIMVIGGIVIYKLNNITIRQTKDYDVIYVGSEDIVDAKVMISPPEKYSQLLQIDENMRKKVANYMKENNLKLKSGKQEFIRNNPTFDELIKNGFEFEAIE